MRNVKYIIFYVYTYLYRHHTSYIAYFAFSDQRGTYSICMCGAYVCTYLNIHTYMYYEELITDVEAHIKYRGFNYTSHVLYLVYKISQ